MEFEWDPAKRRTNLAKHGVDFEDAARIFDGPVFERLDDREDYGEDRMLAFGEIDGLILAVVYADRGPVRRIISVRRANKHERKAYHAALAERASKG